MTHPNPGPGEPNCHSGEPDLRPGERKLHDAIHNLRRPPTHPQPISIEPTNPLEAILIERIQQLEADILELKARVNWLILAIVGACLTFILKTLFA